MDELLTTVKVAGQLGAYRHQVVQLADQLEREGKLRLVRLGQYRLIRALDVRLIKAELDRRPGWARRPAPVA